MGIQTIKVLRTISKIVLLVIVLGLLGWGGYYVYRSIAFKPQNIVVTNITDSSATITWTTSSKMNGVVYYKKDSSVLPGPLGIIGSRIGYDDRDVSDAQTACVNEFNKDASENKDENFSVSGENFNCDDARVTGMGKYYTHSVTIKDLDPESTYYFAMGDGIWSFKSDVASVKTFELLQEVKEPSPVFGRVVGDDGTYSRDALVYITFRDGSEEQDSVMYSSTSNDDGGWYLDAAAVRDSDGNILELELTNDTFNMHGVYSNYGTSGEEKYILGYFNGAYPDIVVEKNYNASSLWNLIAGRVYAGVDDNALSSYKSDTSGLTAVQKVSAVCTKCTAYVSASDLQKIAAEKADGGTSETLESLASRIGTGNAAKISAALSTDGNVNFEDISVSQNAGNIYSLTGTVVPASNPEDVNISYSSDGVATATYTTITDASRGGATVVTTTCTKSSGCDDTTSSYALEGDSSMYECEDGSEVYDATYCGGDSGCTEGSCSGNLTCVDGIYTPVTDSCNYNPVSLNSTQVHQETCNVSAEFNNRADLSSCSISCDGSAVTFSASNCKKILPGSEEINSPTTANYAFTREGDVVVSEIALDKLVKNTNKFEQLVKSSEGLQQIVWSDIHEMESNAGNTISNTSLFDTYCTSVGGKMEGVYPYKCTPSSSSVKGISVVSEVYAEESASNSTYALYLPNYGLYSFELGDYTVSSEVSDGETLYLFYVEANGKDGFQMPVDPDNPTSEEDIILDSSAYEITYSQESTAQQYDIEKGINLLSFNFVPVSTDLGAYTAEDLINQASDNGVEIQYISAFEGGRWYSGYSCSSDTCTGTNFTIVPGRGYVIYATNDGTITIPGYNLTSSVPVAFSSGWNLVGIHGYTTAYTARTLIDSINKIEGLTSNNVSWWPTSKGKYEGLQVENNTEYGLDFAISPTNGYFVRISEYAPTDTKCKSILWNDGGTLNGTCGNTK